jgi:hypothetical protein
MGGRHDALLLVLPTLEHGGMELQLLTLARAFRAAGGRATFLAGAGPLEAAARSIGVVELVDWAGTPRVETARLARSLSGPDTAAVLQADPATLHVLPSLAVACRVHLCLHNRPGTFEEWFAPAVLERFRALVPALYASGRVGISVSREAYAASHAHDFGIPRHAVKPWLPGVEYRPGQSAISAGPISRIGVVSRLSEEKLPVVEAGARLVAAGRSAGADVTLELYGEGPAEERVRRVVDERVGGHARFHGPTDRPQDVIEPLDVVVNAGRAAIEGLVLGRRVVTFSSDPRAISPLGGMVTPTRFETLRNTNFLWPADELIAPEAVWNEVRHADRSSVRAVRDRARRELSADSVLRGHLATLAGTEATAEVSPELLEAVLDQMAMLDDARAAAEAVADALWAEHRAG